MKNLIDITGLVLTILLIILILTGDLFADKILGDNYDRSILENIERQEVAKH